MAISVNVLLNNITLGYSLNTGPSTISAGSGYVSQATGSESENETYYMAETRLAAQTANMTWTTNNSWVIGAVEIAAARLAQPSFLQLSSHNFCGG